MAMPKTLSLPPDVPNDWGYSPSSGVEITWTPTAGRLDINGWYDGCVHIQGGSMTLREFFAVLGITEKDCSTALKEDTK
jgi:hypothetical protein